MRLFRPFFAWGMLALACFLFLAWANERAAHGQENTTPTEILNLMPRTMLTPEATMKVMACGDVENCEAPMALYANGVMYLRTDFNPRDEKDRGVLLHEFVHHLRFLGGEKRDCGIEREAYEASIAWYKARGKDPDDDAHVGKLMAGPLMRAMIYDAICNGGF